MEAKHFEFATWWLVVQCTMCCLDSHVPQCLKYPLCETLGYRRFTMWDTGVYYAALRWTLGYIFGKITDLEFEVHKNIFLYEFLAIEQAGTNICWMGYQDRNFKICLSLFGCEELKLPKQHIVQWCTCRMPENTLLGNYWQIQNMQNGSLRSAAA